jgi:hypothetical protein
MPAGLAKGARKVTRGVAFRLHCVARGVMVGVGNMNGVDLMAWFKEIKSNRRFTVTDKDHPYYNQIVAIYDTSRSFTSVAPIGEDGFADAPVPTFHDQIRDLYQPS